MKEKEAKKKALESLFGFLKDQGKERMKAKKFGVQVSADSKEELIDGLDKAKEIVKSKKDEKEEEKQ